MRPLGPRYTQNLCYSSDLGRTQPASTARLSTPNKVSPENLHPATTKMEGNQTYSLLHERLRSFPRFALRSSSVHEGKIIIFERFQSSLTIITQLN